jgi:hypothetical protein
MSSTPKQLLFPVAAADAAPNWMAAMSSIGTWYAINGSAPDLGLTPTALASSVDPDPTNSQPYSGAIGFNGIWTAWNSAIFAPTVGTFGSLLIWGHGHRDGYNNCVPRFDMEDRIWSLLKQPSTAGPFSSGAALSNGQYTDGTPSPPHVYTFLQRDPVTNSMICLKSISNIDAPDFGSSSLAIAQMLSLDTLAWRRSAQFTSFSCVTSGAACVDTTRNVLWALNHTNGHFARFDPNVDNGNGTFGTWTLFSTSGQLFSDDLGMEHDPVNDAVVIANFNTGNWWRKDPNNMSAARVQISLSGLPTISDQSSLNYSSVLGGMVLHERGTGDVYLVTTSDNWSSATPALLTTNVNGKSFTVGSGGMYQRSRTIEYGSQVVQVCSLNMSSPVLAMRLA